MNFSCRSTSDDTHFNLASSTLPTDAFTVITVFLTAAVLATASTIVTHILVFWMSLFDDWETRI